jgi:hypothetical protein
MTVERYLSVKIKKWRLTLFKTKAAIIVSIILGIILLTLNMTLSLLIDYDTKATNITCFVSDDFTKTMQVRVFLLYIHDSYIRSQFVSNLNRYI